MCMEIHWKYDEVSRAFIAACSFQQSSMDQAEQREAKPAQNPKIPVVLPANGESEEYIVFLSKLKQQYETAAIRPIDISSCIWQIT